MSSFGGRVLVGDTAQASSTDRGPQQVFRRVLVPVADASQVERAVELARRAGASEARVLHLNLREAVRGLRFALEDDASAARVAEADVLELGMANIPASGQVRHALVDRAAEAIIDEAIEWGADLIVLGSSRRGELATRLFGSVTLRVLLHAPCPVLVAPSAGKDRLHRLGESVTSAAGPGSGAGDDHAVRSRSGSLSTAPAR